MIGLAPRAAELGDDDFLSVLFADGLLFPSGAGVVELLADGDMDLLVGVRDSDFLSSPFSELFTLLAFDDGRVSSLDFLVITLLSYGLNASFTSTGLFRDALFSLFSLVEAGDERVKFSALAVDDFLFFSNGEINGFEVGVSAPIWLHV